MIESKTVMEILSDKKSFTDTSASIYYDKLRPAIPIQPFEFSFLSFSCYDTCHFSQTLPQYRK